MIEIPRACLTADEIAKEAEFFCFGTNDLTQMTFGFSRDDAGKFLDALLRRTRSSRTTPSPSWIRPASAPLVQMAAEKGKQGSSGACICGICGEHGGDPMSVEFCHRDRSELCFLQPLPCAHRPSRPPRRPRSARAGNPGLLL